jgi:hypothetical protein
MKQFQTLSMKTTLLSATLAAVLALGACGKGTEPTQADITGAMTAYLARRGDLCLAKTQWPIDVTEREIEAGGRNAAQMPVLDKLGLVTLSVATIDKVDDDGVSHAMKVRRYALTDAGRKYVVVRETRSADGRTTSQGDFCAAKLTLDKVVGWTPDPAPRVIAHEAAAPAPADVHQMVVTYTYKVAPAPWIADADAQKAFPVIAGVLRGAGKAQLDETVRLTDSGWVAVDLL